MICLLAGNYLEASRWARGQLLHESEWFFPYDRNELLTRDNFHVLVIGTAGQNVPSSYFEDILQTARRRGRINRV